MRSCAPSLHLPCPPSFPVSLAIAIQISQSRVEPRIEKSFRKLREKTSEQWISDYVETQRTANLEVYDAFGRKVSEPTTRPQRALINRNCSRLLRRVELLERRSGFKRSFLQRFFFFWQFFDRKPSRVIRCFVRDWTIAKLLLFSANNGRV